MLAFELWDAGNSQSISSKKLFYLLHVMKIVFLIVLKKNMNFILNFNITDKNIYIM